MNSGEQAVRLARALPGLFREVDAGSDPGPLLVGGPPLEVATLSRALSEGGDQSLIRSTGLVGIEGLDGAALVYVIAGDASPADERVLREAERAGLPVVCLVLGGAGWGGRVLPYVPPTNVVRAPALDATTVDAVAERLARRAGEVAWMLAQGLPVLRRPVADALVARFARQNALIGAAVFVPGADLPLLTLNELRLVLRIGAAYGLEPARTRRIALGAILGLGFGLRGLARRAVQLAPIPGFAVKSGVAYAGTRAIGKAAIALAEREAT